MYIGMGIFLVAVGAILWLFVNSTLGIIFLILGVLAIVLSFAQVGPFTSSRREVIIDRERRAPADREIVRERETR